MTVMGLPDFRNNSRIVVDRQIWRRSGALTFTGVTTLGQPVDDGQTDLILSGEYEFRERSPFLASTETIKTGSLRRGETASVLNLRAGRPALQFGVLTPDNDDRAFRVSMVSETGKVGMSLAFYGNAAPIIISPSWVDRTLVSPTILALVSGLIVVSSLLAIPRSR